MTAGYGTKVYKMLEGYPSAVEKELNELGKRAANKFWPAPEVVSMTTTQLTVDYKRVPWVVLLVRTDEGL